MEGPSQSPLVRNGHRSACIFRGYQNGGLQILCQKFIVQMLTCIYTIIRSIAQQPMSISN
jgi:hypothetical protein